MRRRLTAGIAIAALGMLTACGSTSDDAPATSSTATGGSATAGNGASSSEPAQSPSSAPGSTGPEQSTAPPAQSSAADASASPAPEEADFPADSSPDTATASADAQLVLVDVRSASHDGYDRVVLEFSGPGTAGWTAQYASAASRQGSGEPISVDGDALLDITVTGSAIPMEGDPTVNAGQIAPSGTSSVTAIFNDGTFEGITHVVIGTNGEQPFRVFTIADPPRVVIDVAN